MIKIGKIIRIYEEDESEVFFSSSLNNQMADALQTIIEWDAGCKDHSKNTLPRVDQNFLFHYATCFEIPTKKYTDIDSKLRIVYRGKKGKIDDDVWAILDPHSNCYNKIEDDWECEPSPSNRTDKFLEECRFTLKKALRKIKKLR